MQLDNGDRVYLARQLAMAEPPLSQIPRHRPDRYVFEFNDNEGRARSHGVGRIGFRATYLPPKDGASEAVEFRVYPELGPYYEDWFRHQKSPEVQIARVGDVVQFGPISHKLLAIRPTGDKDNLPWFEVSTACEKVVIKAPDSMILAGDRFAEPIVRGVNGAIELVREINGVQVAQGARVQVSTGDGLFEEVRCANLRAGDLVPMLNALYQVKQVVPSEVGYIELERASPESAPRSPTLKLGTDTHIFPFGAGAGGRLNKVLFNSVYRSKNAQTPPMVEVHVARHGWQIADFPCLDPVEVQSATMGMPLRFNDAVYKVVNVVPPDKAAGVCGWFELAATPDNSLEDSPQLLQLQGAMQADDPRYRHGVIVKASIGAELRKVIVGEDGDGWVAQGVQFVSGPSESLANWFKYPDLRVGDIAPMLNYVYRIESITPGNNQTAPAVVNLTRLPWEDVAIPSAQHIGKDTYVFVLGPNGGGKLAGIDLVADLVESTDGEATAIRLSVPVSYYIREGIGTKLAASTQTLRVGDIAKIGDVAHKVVNIVAPDKSTGMLGWFELAREPERTADSK